MIYLVDSAAYKVIFDRSIPDEAFAISREEQQKVQEFQISLITTGAYPENKVLKVHPFISTEKKIKNKECCELDLNNVHELAPENIMWKVISVEEQGEEKYVEIE